MVLVLGILLAGSAAPLRSKDRRVLVFSKTAGFRHDSIPDGVAAIRRLGAENGFEVEASEDSSVFEDGQLAGFDVIVFLCTTGDLLDENQKAAFQRYLRGGGGFAGIHSASDTEHGWPWYGGLVGAYFHSHPAIAPAAVTITDPVHSSTRGLPARWSRTDEWYNFDRNPRPNTHVLATLDESTYVGEEMGTDHPISWCHFYDGGRSWYTALGHTRETYSEPLFLRHLLGGIQFAAGFPECEGPVARPVAPRRSP